MTPPTTPEPTPPPTERPPLTDAELAEARRLCERLKALELEPMCCNRPHWSGDPECDPECCGRPDFYGRLDVTEQERDSLVRLLVEVDRLRQEKTCATCRYWTSHYNVDSKPKGNGACAIGVMCSPEPYTHKDFGCNWWQVRDQLTGTAGGER